MYVSPANISRLKEIGEMKELTPEFKQMLKDHAKQNDTDERLIKINETEKKLKEKIHIENWVKELKSMNANHINNQKGGESKWEA